jgi:hypothetical protein
MILKRIEIDGVFGISRADLKMNSQEIRDPEAACPDVYEEEAELDRGEVRARPALPCSYCVPSYDTVPLNERELGVVRSLLAWVASEQRVTQEMVTQIVVEHFHVDDLLRLTRSAYDDIVRFLVYLEVDFDRYRRAAWMRTDVWW